MSQMELQIAASGLDWVIVRPPRLVDGPATNSLEVSLDLPTGKHEITRADLARFLLEQVEGDKYLRKWPMLAA